MGLPYEGVGCRLLGVSDYFMCLWFRLLDVCGYCGCLGVCYSSFEVFGFSGF